MLEYRELRKEDFEAVMALELRPIELKEGQVAHGLPTDELLADSIASSSYAWVITWRGRVCGVFGLALHKGPELTVGVPWLLSNEAPFRVASGLFLRTSKDIVEFMRTKCDLLTNIVSEANETSIRWLRWLGFTMVPEKIIFDNDPTFPFVRFTMGGKGVPQHV
jgi:hypothetical protein